MHPCGFSSIQPQSGQSLRDLSKRAQAAGCPVVALTLDQATAGGRETLARARRQDEPRLHRLPCQNSGAVFLRKPMFKDLDTSGLNGSSTPHLTWEFVDRLKDLTTMKVVLKGIVTEEDADWRSNTVWMGSLSPTTEGEARRVAARRSSLCPRSWRPSAARCRS